MNFGTGNSLRLTGFNVYLFPLSARMTPALPDNF